MNDLRRANRNMTWKLLAIAAGSFAFGFALVPLYYTLCSVTGYGDRTKLLQKVSAIEHPDLTRTVTVEFLADVASAGTFEFRPVVRRANLNAGGAGPDRSLRFPQLCERGPRPGRPSPEQP